MAFATLWAFILDTRAPYFAAMGLPIVLGTAVAWAQRGVFEVEAFVLSVLAGILLQAGNTMTNDYFNYQRTGDTRQLSPLVPSELVLQGALAFLIVGVMVGVYIALRHGVVILALGAAGIVSGYLYSVPRWRLSGTAIGELLAGAVLGLLTTVGGYYVQAGDISATVLWVALPVALLMGAVLILNNVQLTDGTVPRSLLARLGRQRAGLAYGLPAMLGFGVLIVGVAVAAMPIMTLLGLLALPLAAVAVVLAQEGRLEVAIASAVGAHLGLTTLLVLAFVLIGLGR